MATHTKCSYRVLSIIGLTLNVFLTEGQSTVGGNQTEVQQMVDKLPRVLGEFERYFRESIALTKSLRSDIHNLKGEVVILKNRIEDHDKSVNSSNQELKRHLQKQQRGRRKCPEGFNNCIAGFPKCYAVLIDKVDWTTAQQRCSQLDENAQLAVILNSRENHIITDIIKNLNCETQNRFHGGRMSYGINAFWIGARRRSFDCNLPVEWISRNGTTSPMQYSDWAPDEPTCSRQSEACVSLNKYVSSMWNDLTCTWSACPVCEVTVQA